MGEIPLLGSLISIFPVRGEQGVEEELREWESRVETLQAEVLPETLHFVNLVSPLTRT